MIAAIWHYTLQQTPILKLKKKKKINWSGCSRNCMGQEKRWNKIAEYILSSLCTLDMISDFIHPFIIWYFKFLPLQNPQFKSSAELHEISYSHWLHNNLFNQQLFLTLFEEKLQIVEEFIFLVCGSVTNSFHITLRNLIIYQYWN